MKKRSVPGLLMATSYGVLHTPTPGIPWLQTDRAPENAPLNHFSNHGVAPPCGENPFITELEECCKELDEGHCTWTAHKKEAAWGLRRVQLHLESEKESKVREKM
ncbi:hypothetical protein BC332_23338 [Capsicum chinense]|nr:hypothetical protein BC332_23338 [Capsicum chinense]